MKVLGIAFEPWETEIVAASNSFLTDFSNITSTAVFVADLYQFHYRHAKSNLTRIFAEYPQASFSLEDEFHLFQRRNRGPINYQEKILEWSRANRLRVSTRLIATSDHIFSCHERSPHYKPLSTDDKYAIFYFYALKITNILDQYEPDLVWTIERNYLAKYIFAILCASRGIEMKTLLISRISKFWILSRSFTPLLFQADRNSHSSSKLNPQDYDNISEQSRSSSKVYLDNWRLNYAAYDTGRSLYKSGTDLVNQILFNNSLRLHFQIAKDIRLLLRRILELFYTSWRFSILMPHDYIYTHQFWRSSFFYLFSFFRLLRFRFLGTPFSRDSIPDKPFFYYPLSTRPEGSTFTLSKGLTDETAITILSQTLPFGTVLAVKENPSMVEHRRFSFYKHLSRIPGVVIIDASVSSAELVLGSLGVIALSGTALLEASLNDIPSHAIGQPEFIHCLSSSGIDKVEEFMTSCINSSCYTGKTLAEQYVAFIFDRGIELELGWPSVANSSIVKSYSRKIAQYISQ